MAVEVTVIKSTAVDPTFIQQIVATMPEWFQQGGVVMWLLLFTSFLVTIVTLERTTSWLTYLLKKEHFLINDCFASLNKDEKEQALIFCQTLDTPALNMLKQGINTLPFCPKIKMDCYAKMQISQLSQGQSLLLSAVTVALLLGALGTTLGLIDSLNNLSQQGVETLSAVVGVIAHALIALASGLCVALFAFIPYKIFQAQLRKLNQHLQNISDEFSHICQQKHLITNQISAIMKIQEQRLTVALSETETVAEQSEMPYHYEFKEGSDEVNVSLHKEMKDLQTTSQSSIIDMYKNELNISFKKKKIAEDAPSSLQDRYESAVNEKQELYGINEVELQEQQETAHLKKTLTETLNK
ncbi:MotA/TolQ/ExbB proton channel family protein [Psychromonas hadalis]|uniref:MotA/TolQ/ExbB proton channel family protein n=1 Tax=Psychromonas hadalis TaxID=211669 RepID=UPI0003B4EB6C|nr:MotA/TolQ/ExbB proton channel family protein [Psychromonas hadalis]